MVRCLDRRQFMLVRLAPVGNVWDTIISSAEVYGFLCQHFWVSHRKVLELALARGNLAVAQRVYTEIESTDGAPVSVSLCCALHAGELELIMPMLTSTCPDLHFAPADSVADLFQAACGASSAATLLLM